MKTRGQQCRDAQNGSSQEFDDSISTSDLNQSSSISLCLESASSLEYSLDQLPPTPLLSGARKTSSRLPPLSPPPNGTNRRRSSLSVSYSSPNGSPVSRSHRPPLNNSPRTSPEARRGGILRSGRFCSARSSHSKSPRRRPSCSDSPRSLTRRSDSSRPLARRSDSSRSLARHSDSLRSLLTRRRVAFYLPDEASVANSAVTDESMQFGEIEDFDEDHYFMPEDENDEMSFHERSFRCVIPFVESLDSKAEVCNHLLEYSKDRCVGAAESYAQITMDDDDIDLYCNGKLRGVLDETIVLEHSLSSSPDEEDPHLVGNASQTIVATIGALNPLYDTLVVPTLDLSSLYNELPPAPPMHFRNGSVSSGTSSESPIGVTDFPEVDDQKVTKSEDRASLAPPVLSDSINVRSLLCPKEVVSKLSIGKEVTAAVTSSPSGRIRTATCH